jgi:type IV pilus assembly protein PilF
MKYLAVTWVLSVALLTGCTTQTTTNISNFEGSSTVTNKFDETKAAQSRVEAAKLYLQKNSLQRAKFHLDKAASHDDSYPDLYLTLGYYYQIARNEEEAKQAFKKALRLDRDNPEYKNAFGQFLCQQGEYEEAFELLNEAINTPTYSNAAQAYVNAGQCKRQQGDQEQAIDYFRQALNLNKNMPTALIEMAEYEFQQQRYGRTVQYIERYKEEARHTPRSIWLALRAEHKRGNLDAVASYALLLQNMYPDSEETILFLDSKQQWQ